MDLNWENAAQAHKRYLSLKVLQGIFYYFNCRKFTGVTTNLQCEQLNFSTVEAILLKVTKQLKFVDKTANIW